MKKIARDMNFSFSDKYIEGDDALLTSLNQLAIFSQGVKQNGAWKLLNLIPGSKTQCAWNVMKGNVHGVSVIIMDHFFQSGSGKNRKTSKQTVFILQSEKLRLPSFMLRPDKSYFKLANWLGYQDINFDSRPKFSKLFYLHGNDSQSIRAIFNEDAFAYFEQHKDLSVDGSANRLVVFRLSKNVATNDIKAFLEEGLKVFNLFKR